MDKKLFEEFNKDASWLKKGIVYHRGKHDDRVKENTIGAIEKAILDNLAVEIDVRLTKDDMVVVSHDDSLKRIFKIDKKISDCSYIEVKELTKGEVPLLKDVLEFVNDRIGLMIEIKSSRSKMLSKKVYEILKEYKGRYVIVSFNPFILRYFRKKAPYIIRGQLSYSYRKSKYNFILKFMLSRLLFNFISKPHFISYGIDSCNAKLLAKYRKKGYFIIGWTYKDERNKENLSKIYDNMIIEELSIKEF